MGRRHAQDPGHRSLVADRDRLAASPAIRSASACCRSSPARRRWRCPATTCACSTKSGNEEPRQARSARSSRSCRSRRVPPEPVARGRATSESYLDEFPGFYKTADAGYIDDEGYVYIMGRTDDIINVAGHRLSTGGMEEALRNASRCRRMRGDRHRGRPQGRGPLRLYRPQSGRRPAIRHDIEKEMGGPGAASEDRPGRRLQAPPSRWRGCRRPARERSCAAPSRRSPTASPGTMPATDRRSGDAR